MNEEAKTGARSTLLALLRRAAPLRLPASNLILREVRAALGAVTALVGLQMIVTLLSAASAWRRGAGFRFDPEPYVEAAIAAAVVAGLLLGVICGAEEQENGTADFALRLPIPRWRILAEKIAGSAIAFLLWAVVSALLGAAGMLVSGEKLAVLASLHKIVAIKEAGIYAALSWAALFYCCGVAAGAWIGRAVPAAVAAGLGAAFYTLIGWRLLGPFRSGLEAAITGHWTPPALWAGCLAALLAAAARYQTREGT